MVIEVTPDTVERLYKHSSAAGFWVTTSADKSLVVRALERTCERCMAEIAFPDAPEEGSYASHWSPVEESSDGELGVWFDMADAEAYREDLVMERLLKILLEVLADAGVTDGSVRPYFVPDDEDEGSDIPVRVRNAFDGRAPAGLPAALDGVLRDPAFAVDRARSTSIDDDGWEVHLAVDGDIAAVANAQELALRNAGLTTHRISVPFSQYITFRGMGQRGRVNLYDQRPLSAHIYGQVDEPVPALSAIRLPAGSIPVIAQQLSNPDRIEFTHVFPSEVDETISHFVETLTTDDFNVEQTQSERLTRLDITRPDLQGGVVVFDAGDFTYGSVWIEVERKRRPW